MCLSVCLCVRTHTHTHSPEAVQRTLSKCPPNIEDMDAMGAGSACGNEDTALCSDCRAFRQSFLLGHINPILDLLGVYNMKLLEKRAQLKMRCCGETRRIRTERWCSDCSSDYIFYGTPWSLKPQRTWEYVCCEPRELTCLIGTPKAI